MSFATLRCIGESSRPCYLVPSHELHGVSLADVFFDLCEVCWIGELDLYSKNMSGP
jgi:hypothetical protein